MKFDASQMKVWGGLFTGSPHVSPGLRLFGRESDQGKGKGGKA